MRLQDGDAALHRSDAAQASRGHAALEVRIEKARHVLECQRLCWSHDGRRGSRPALTSPMNRRSQSRASSIDMMGLCLPASMRGIAKSFTPIR